MVCPLTLKLRYSRGIGGTNTGMGMVLYGGGPVRALLPQSTTSISLANADGNEEGGGGGALAWEWELELELELALEVGVLGWGLQGGVGSGRA